MINCFLLFDLRLFLSENQFVKPICQMQPKDIKMFCFIGIAG